MADEVLNCVDCKLDFVFTEGEQKFFATKVPPLSKPRRCKPCRDARRTANGGTHQTRPQEPHGIPVTSTRSEPRWIGGNDAPAAQPAPDRDRKRRRRDSYGGDGF